MYTLKHARDESKATLEILDDTKNTTDKFASGTDLGDELKFHVINEPLSLDDEVSDKLESEGDTKNTTYREIESFKVFRQKTSSPLAITLKAGKKPMVIDASMAKWKTAPKQLPQEVIEGQFGNTMKEAAENLKVSLSTLKRKCKDYDIKVWQGPNVVKKKVVNSLSNNQSNINEEDNSEIQEPSIVNRNENTLTIKAEYADDMIKFDLCTSQASLVNIEKEIGKKLNLTFGTYKLKYLDKEEDLILLTSDQDVRDCIKYFRNLRLPVVRLRVLLSPQKSSS